MVKIGQLTSGFAREEILLGTVVLGGMGALGAVAINSGGLLATPADKTITLLEQVETANLKFFQQYGYWPHEVTNNTPTANVAVLQDLSLATEIYLGSAKNPILNTTMDVSQGTKTIRHTMGGGGTVRQVAREDDPTYRYLITLDNLTPEEANTLDQKIDKTTNPTQGRITITYVGQRAVVAYHANPRLSAAAAITY